MKTRRKRTVRGTEYRALAEGYAILKSPVAESFGQAADHYDETDPPVASTETNKVTDADRDQAEEAMLDPEGTKH